jgi:hypothetical protein
MDPAVEFRWCHHGRRIFLPEVNLRTPPVTRRKARHPFRQFRCRSPQEGASWVRVEHSASMHNPEKRETCGEVSDTTFEVATEARRMPPVASQALRQQQQLLVEHLPPSLRGSHLAQGVPSIPRS